MPPVTPATLRAAERHLRQHDAVMATLISQIGPCQLRYHRQAYPVLVLAIISQQLSNKAAATIMGRFVERFGDAGRLDASVVAQSPVRSLRAVGLSDSKSRCLKELSRAYAAGDISRRSLARSSDDQVLDVLTTYRGVGPWTAQMFLIFALNRLNVFSPGDLGLIKAIQRAYRLRTRPGLRTLERITGCWEPYRSIACWYLWASVDAPSADDGEPSLW